MHAESGYWRPKPDGTIEVVIAQSTGLVEVQVSKCTCSDYRSIIIPRHNTVMVEHEVFSVCLELQKVVVFIQESCAHLVSTK